MAEPARVLIIDDHPTLRSGLRAELERTGEFTICAEADSATDAIALIRRTNAELAILDIELNDGSGLNVLEAASSQDNAPLFVCHTVHVDARSVVQAVSLGARGFVAKTSDPETLVRAARTVHNGNTFLCPHATNAIFSWIRSVPDAGSLTGDERFDSLSARQKEVFLLVCDGYDTQEIASRLNLSRKTVANYRLAVMDALEVENVMEMRLYAEEHGLLPRRTGSTL